MLAKFLHCLQPIDASYFKSTYFLVTTAIAIILVLFVAIFGDEEDAWYDKYL